MLDHYHGDWAKNIDQVYVEPILTCLMPARGDLLFEDN